MDDIEAYLALQDEIWRLNVKIHKEYLKPTIYREGKTYCIMYAFLESDVLWFQCYLLNIFYPYLHFRVPFVEDVVIYCVSPYEWEHLLLESNVARHVYYEENTSKTTRQLKVTSKLLDKPVSSTV